MGNVDCASKVFMRKPEVFRDVFNLLFHDTDIEMSQITPMDPDLMFSQIRENVPHGNNRSAYVKRQKRVKKAFQLLAYRRDILQNCVCVSGEKTDYLLAGIENQSYIDYLMPARVMLYDALTLHMQIESRLDRQGMKNVHEFLSGVPKGSKFKGMVTIVCYFGTDPWDGPTRLHEMLDLHSPILSKLVPDYPIYIVDPHTLEKAQLQRLNSSLREVFACIKASGAGQDLEMLVNSDERFKHIDPDAANLIKASLNFDISFPPKSCEVNMCRAIKEIKQEAYENGEKVGFENGKTIGFENGKTVGFENGEKVGFENGEKVGFENGEKVGFENGEKVGFENGKTVGFENGKTVGFENGVKQKAKQTALNLIRMHVLSYHEIAAATQLPLIEVQALAAEVQK